MQLLPFRVSVAIGAILILVGFVLPRPHANRTVLFQLTENGDSVVIGIPKDELLSYRGRGAQRLRNAVADHGPVKVWQYDLRKSESGEYLQIAPVRRIELTSQNVASARLGASIRLPPD
jgi:hypothetical protein